MADHIRRQLREAVSTALTGLATTGSNVFQERIYALPEGTATALAIYTNGDVVDPQALETPEIQKRDVIVVVEGLARLGADLDDMLDQISKEVEIRMASVIVVASKSLICSYTGCTISIRGEGDSQHGVAVMQFIVDLYTLAATPDTLFM